MEWFEEGEGGATDLCITFVGITMDHPGNAGYHSQCYYICLCYYEILTGNLCIYVYAVFSWHSGVRSFSSIFFICMFVEYSIATICGR